MLLVQYYVFVKFFNVPGLTEEQKSINEKYLLPDVSIYKICINNERCIHLFSALIGHLKYYSHTHPPRYVDNKKCNKFFFFEKHEN